MAQSSIGLLLTSSKTIPQSSKDYCTVSDDGLPWRITIFHRQIIDIRRPSSIAKLKYWRVWMDQWIWIKFWVPQVQKAVLFRAVPLFYCPAVLLCCCDASRKEENKLREAIALMVSFCFRKSGAARSFFALIYAAGEIENRDETKYIYTYI